MKVKNLPADAGDTRDSRFDSWVGKIPWRKTGQPALLFLPGESHGQKSLVGKQSMGATKSDMTDLLNMQYNTNKTYIKLTMCARDSSKILILY